MVWDSFFFNGSAFNAGLCLLEYGVDAFIHSLAIVARRAGVSETLIALITAGAAWEDLHAHNLNSTTRLKLSARSRCRLCPPTATGPRPGKRTRFFNLEYTGRLLLAALPSWSRDI
jgi:hypothetical protein